MFQFGYNTGVINTPQLVIRKFIAECLRQRRKDDPYSTIPNEEDSLDSMELDAQELADKEIIISVVVSIFAIGGMLGGFSGGYIGNKLGR